MNEASNQPRTKYDKLFNVFEQFYASLPELSDRRISDLRDSWNLAKAQYEKFLSAGESKARIAAGLEQGLRELPLLLADVELKNRSQVVAALSSAVRTFYPDFAAKEAKCLDMGDHIPTRSLPFFRARLLLSTLLNPVTQLPAS